MPDPKRLEESYARLYDDILDNDKWLALGAEAFGLYCAALVYCHRNDTDGRIHVLRLRNLLQIRAPLRVAGKLVSAKLFERDGDWFAIHDYTLHQTTRSEREEGRLRFRQYGLKGAAIRWGHDYPNEGANSHPNEPPNDKVKGKVKGKGVESSIQPSLLTAEEPTDDPVKRVFETWRDAFARGPRTILDNKRRRVIEAALKTYSPKELEDAIFGYTRDPWPDRKVRNDLTLLLRDAEHIEAGMRLRSALVDYGPRGGEMEPVGRVMNRSAEPRGIGEPED